MYSCFFMVIYEWQICVEDDFFSPSSNIHGHSWLFVNAKKCVVFSYSLYTLHRPLWSETNYWCALYTPVRKGLFYDWFVYDWIL